MSDAPLDDRFARFAATGDEALRNELVLEHQGLAIAFARRYARTGRVIDGRLKQHFRDDGWDIRVPLSIKQLAVAVRSTTGELTNELGRVPSPAELADRLGVTVDQIALALDAANAHRADELDSDPSSDEPWDVVDTGLVVPELLDGLPEQERVVVSLRFYGELSQSQIAEQIGVSQMQVSRLLRRALARLRTKIGDA